MYVRKLQLPAPPTFLTHVAADKEHHQSLLCDKMSAGVTKIYPYM